jgi:acetate---CoA ligase (ADP-forming)
VTDRITALLRPRSVAVIGASSDPLKRGYQAIRRLQEDGFPHPIYPVNPKDDEILGLRAYPDVEAIDGEVDLALLVTPAPSVPDLLHACGRKGVRAAVVIAVGFGETGEEGRTLEEEAAAAASQHGIALVGPNTNGVFTLPARMNLVGAADVPEGRLALVCQSGNMGLSLFTDAAAMGSVGYSSYVGIGNEAGVRYHELLPHLGDDPDTGAVVMYAEGFRDGRAFLAAATQLTPRKPIVLYKAGRTEAARRSALSHTGAIAGRPEVADALLRQAGIEVVERSDELLPVSEALLRQPPVRRGRVAVLADGGGHATIAADALGRLGLVLAEVSDVTRQRLADLLPAAASTRNPVDVAGGTDRDPSLFAACVECLLADDAVGGVLCVGLLGGYGIRFSGDLAAGEEAAARSMAQQARDAGKPLVVQSAYAHHRPRAHQLLREAGVGVHASVETAVRCLAALARRGTFLASAADRSTLEVPSRAAASSRRALTEPVGRDLLLRHGLDVGAWELATNAEAAADAAEQLGGAVALKVVAPEVVHKSDVGGVELDVRGGDEARTAYRRIVERVRAAQPTARLEGVLVTRMAPPGLELLVGATTDPTFGPIVTVGSGGTAVEVLGDAAFRAVPVTRTEVHELLDELAVSAMLDGHRGSAAVDREAIVDLVVAVSDVLRAEPGIVELDLNPVIAHPDGLDLVDVRVVTTASGAQDRIEATGRGTFAPIDR